MSNEALTWAFGLELKPGPKFVLVALADYADEAHSCFPGVPKIAERTGYGQTAVRAHLDRLQELGLITEERRHRADGGRTSNRYVLAVGVSVAPESEGGVTPESDATPSAGIRGGVAPESDEPSAGIRGGNEPPAIPKGDPPAMRPAVALVATPVDVAFAEVWATWPKKVDRKDARRAFTSALKRAPMETVVAAALEHARAYRQHYTRADVQFVPGLAVWLNKDRWENPIPGPRAVSSKQTAFERNMQITMERRRDSDGPARGRPALDRGIGN